MVYPDFLPYKMFEKLIRKRLMKYLKVKNYTTNQHGFRAKQFCLSHLFDQQDQTIEALCENKAIDVIYADFAKAFDNCDNEVIAYKFRQIGILSKTGKCIYNILLGRTQRVLVNGLRSEVAVTRYSINTNAFFL